MAFKKGQSGNPGGRPKEKEFLSMLRLAVKTAGKSGEPKLREIAEQAVNLAVAGEPWAVQFVADRLDGKPAQSLEATIRHVAARELSDDELADIAAGSSDGAAESPVDPSQFN